MEIKTILNPTVPESALAPGSRTGVPISPLSRASSAVDETAPPVDGPKKRAPFSSSAVELKKGPPKADIRYPPHQKVDPALLQRMEKFNIKDFGNIEQYCRHIPYASEKKDFGAKSGQASLEVFHYTFTHIGKEGKTETVNVFWDYSTGLVRTTPFFKILHLGKTTPNRAVRLNAGLQDISYNVTGGAIFAQGYWLPFEAAKAILATFCYEIAPALVPMFGADFPDRCLPPDAQAFGTFKIDPVIIADEARKAAEFRRVGSGPDNKPATNGSPATAFGQGHPNGHYPSLRGMDPVHENHPSRRTLYGETTRRPHSVYPGRFPQQCRDEMYDTRHDPRDPSVGHYAASIYDPSFDAQRYSEPNPIPGHVDRYPYHGSHPQQHDHHLRRLTPPGWKHAAANYTSHVEAHSAPHYGISRGFGYDAAGEPRSEYYQGPSAQYTGSYHHYNATADAHHYRGIQQAESNIRGEGPPTPQGACPAPEDYGDGRSLHNGVGVMAGANPLLNAVPSYPAHSRALPSIGGGNFKPINTAGEQERHARASHKEVQWRHMRGAGDDPPSFEHAYAERHPTNGTSLQAPWPPYTGHRHHPYPHRHGPPYRPADSADDLAATVSHGRNGATPPPPAPPFILSAAAAAAGSSGSHLPSPATPEAEGSFPAAGSYRAPPPLPSNYHYGGGQGGDDPAISPSRRAVVWQPPKPQRRPSAGAADGQHPPERRAAHVDDGSSPAAMAQGADHDARGGGPREEQRWDGGHADIGHDIGTRGGQHQSAYTNESPRSSGRRSSPRHDADGGSPNNTPTHHHNRRGRSGGEPPHHLSAGLDLPPRLTSVTRAAQPPSPSHRPSRNHALAPPSPPPAVGHGMALNALVYPANLTASTATAGATQPPVDADAESSAAHALVALVFGGGGGPRDTAADSRARNDDNDDDDGGGGGDAPATTGKRRRDSSGESSETSESGGAGRSDGKGRGGGGTTTGRRKKGAAGSAGGAPNATAATATDKGSRSNSSSGGRGSRRERSLRRVTAAAKPEAKKARHARHSNNNNNAPATPEVPLQSGRGQRPLSAPPPSVTPAVGS